MKRLASFLAVMALSSQLISVGEAPTSTVLSVSQPVSDAITAESIESALSLPLGSLDGITVTALPHEESGRLICEGVPVEAFDYLPRESLDWLVFESFTDSVSAAFSVLPDTGAEARECLLALEDENSPRAVVMRADILAWKRAESEYFSQSVGDF